MRSISELQELTASGDYTLVPVSLELYVHKQTLDNTALGLTVLKNAGYMCRKSTVLGIELDDTPGALEKMLERIRYMNINIDYLYVGYARENGMPLIMVHCDYSDAVENSLKTRVTRFTRRSSGSGHAHISPFFTSILRRCAQIFAPKPRFFTF